MTYNTNPQDLIALLRTFIGDTQIVRAAREAADVIEQQAADLQAASDRLKLVMSINASYVAEITALRDLVGELTALAASEPKNTGN